VPVDDTATLAALDAMMGRLKATGPVVVAKAGLVIQRTGMGLTKVRSGTLRRSWRVESEGNTAEVGPTTAYARRQELGFRGPDRLGRIYRHDPGWPYVKPAFAASKGPVGALAESMVAKAMEG
jgi:hypothetical protein